VRRLHASQFAVLALTGLCLAIPPARAQPRGRPTAATRADIDRLDKKIEEQQRRLDKLVKLQLQYLQMLVALTDGPQAPPVVPDPNPRPPEPRLDGPAPGDPRPVATGEPRPRRVAPVDVKPKKPKPESMGTVVGKVTGAADAVVYIDDIVVSNRGSATMKQENKQFLPSVLVVQKGTTVQFPNLDAFFHNVFSVTPDNSFDLGSYRQGETKMVTMSKPGVVNVYCNMHPQMVGRILVVPNGNFVRAGQDGFFRISNVPAGHHRVVAWAPDARPVVAEAEVVDAEAATLEFELKKGHGGTHLKKDGLPYGSYDK
jgi:plastocyanin